MGNIFLKRISLKLLIFSNQMLSALYTLITWGFYILSPIIAFVVYKVIIKPYRECKYYEKQGGRFVSFYPVTGSLSRCMKDLKETGDYLYTTKRWGTDGNPPRFIVSN